MNHYKFQAATARAIDAHAQAIGTLAQDARVTREFVADLAARTDKLEAKHECDWQNLQNQLLPLQDRMLAESIWTRLRWLVTGR